MGKNQELSGTPNHWYSLKSLAGTNGRRTAVQIGGMLQYQLVVAVPIGGVLQCCPFFKT